MLHAPARTSRRARAARVLAVECLLLAVASAALAWSHGPSLGASVLAGGLVFLVPQAWFAWRAFRSTGAAAAREVVQGFYRAQAGKFLLTAAGFALAFAYGGPLEAAALLIAYIALTVVNGLLVALSGV